MSRIKFLALSALFAASTSVFAGPINVIDYDLLTVTRLVTFSDVAAGNYDGGITSGSVGFNEHFYGQTRESGPGAPDVLTGTPIANPGLILLGGGMSKNLVVTAAGTLAGRGDDGTAGTGAVSIVFPGLGATQLNQFGLQVDGIDGNSEITFNFFSKDGSLVGTKVIDTGMTTGSATFGFASGDLDSVGGLTADIAGISITNNDAGGLFYDNMKWGTNQLPHQGNVAAVPEPETYALMLAGLSVVGFAAKRRRQNRSA
jgi:hypothetical protein